MALNPNGKEENLNEIFNNDIVYGMIDLLSEIIGVYLA